MTPEEAAEEILSGQPYTTCRRCGGSGWDEKRKPPLGLVGLREYCESCKGSGQWLRGDYVTACCIVGKDPPPQPATTMYLKPDQTWKDKLLRYGSSVRSTYFDQISLPPTDEFLFSKEYLGHWKEPEERNDTADAMKYAMERTHHVRKR
jgi:hypothetical protein